MPTDDPAHFYFDTTLNSLNYIVHCEETGSLQQRFPQYRHFAMLGYSAGGWTTTLYAAVDSRITLSFPVAGSIPLTLVAAGSANDGPPEFHLENVNRIADFTEIYLLGAFGVGRKQVQIMNANDGCCYAVAGYLKNPARNHNNAAVPIDDLRAYESQIQHAMSAAGLPGTFELEIDHYYDNPLERTDGHAVSRWAWETVILPQLDVLSGHLQH